MTKKSGVKRASAPRPIRYEDYEPELRRRWGRRVGGPFWDEIHPAFRFGWDAAHDVGLAGHSWEEVESDLADHWTNRQSPSEEMAWDQVRDAVRLAWETARGVLGTGAAHG